MGQNSRFSVQNVDNDSWFLMVPFTSKLSRVPVPFHNHVVHSPYRVPCPASLNMKLNFFLFRKQLLFKIEYSCWYRPLFQKHCYENWKKTPF